MNHNKTLLQAAGAVSGLYIEGNWTSFGMFSGLRVRPDDCPGGYCWNPLSDDVDAFRLAVHAMMTVQVIGRSAEGPSDVTIVTVTIGGQARTFAQSHLGDALAATRMAIVLAAAALATARKNRVAQSDPA